MKKLILFTLIIVFIFGCSQPKTRQEITERYKNGSKKVLVKYKGEGEDENLTKRIVFNKEGEKISYQDFVNNEEWSIIDEIKTETQIIDYLQGDWKFKVGNNDYGTFSNDSLIENDGVLGYTFNVSDDFSFITENNRFGDMMILKIKILSYFSFELLWDNPNPEKTIKMLEGDNIHIIKRGMTFRTLVRK